MTNYLVSIIIPVFNRPLLVIEAIESVLDQTSPDWELILVDDGSTDNTWEVLQKYNLKDNRIRIFKRDREPKGANRCRNMGAEKAKGDYLFFLDSDDLIGETFVETRLNYIEKFPDFDFIVFPCSWFPKNYLTDIYQSREFEKKEDDLIRFLKSDLPWMISGPIWKKKSFMNINGFDESLKSNQEWELHIRAILLNKSYIKSTKNISNDVFIRTDLNYERISSQKTKIQNFDNKIKSLDNFLNIIETPKNNVILDLKTKKAFANLFLTVVSQLNRQEFKQRKKIIQTKWREFYTISIISKTEWIIWSFYIFRIVQENNILKRLFESFVYRFLRKYYLYY